MQGFFYNSSLKNYFNVVAKLFSDLYVMRQSGDDMYLDRVVINMVDGSKVEKARNKINSHMSPLEVAKVNNVFPNINLKFVDMVPATHFSINSVQHIDRYGERQYSPIPINMLLEMNIQTKSFNDSVMIFEQIVPYFRPHFTIQIREIVNAKVINKRDIRLVLQTTSMSNDALGNLEEDEIYDWSLIFEMIGYIYPPQISLAEHGNIIETVFLNFKGDMVSINDPMPTELKPEFESVDFEAKDKTITTEEEWEASDKETIVSRTSNIPIPTEGPSGVRRDE